MKKTCPAALLIFMLLFALIPAVQAQTPQQTLTQYVADLQKSPNDFSLREKIIRHVQTMRPAPAIPETARECYVMAATFMEKAKDNRGYERAIEQYKKALLAAPWWADAYKKQAITQKTSAHYDDAIASLSLYILTQPADARDAQDEIYKLKAMKQSAVLEKEESSPPAVSAPKQNTFDNLLKKIDGRRYACPVGGGYTVVFDVRGKVLTYGIISPGGIYEERERYEISAREFSSNRVGPWPRLPGVPYAVGYTFIINEDGDRVTHRWRMSDGDTGERVHLWQR
jgi:tetratricopeptide (TPR) repeat protein